jgi:hypothetical protein
MEADRGKRASRVALLENLIALSETYDRGNLGEPSPLVLTEQLMALAFSRVARNPGVDGADCRSRCAVAPKCHV